MCFDDSSANNRSADDSSADYPSANNFATYNASSTIYMLSSRISGDDHSWI
jgi:hypothetical protein